MRIFENSKPGRDFDIVGRVQIDYTDLLTGRVKERIEKKNHVFTDSFNSYGWWNYLSKTDEPVLFITDDDTAPDDSFPYLRGNVIGYGTVNAGASGSLRGLYVNAESQIAADIDRGQGKRWKYVYSFTGEQIPSVIKSVGITAQYGNFGAYSVRALPNHWHKYTNIDRSTVARGGKLYSIADTGIVTVRNPFTETDMTINISGTVGSSGRNLSIGMADDTLKAYIIAYSSTEAQRQIYEFADETFAILENTYNWPTLTTQPPRRVFAVYGDEVWFYFSGYAHGNFKQNINPAVTVPLAKDGYNNYFITEMSSSYNGFGSVATKDGMLYYNADCYMTTQGMDIPIWDMKNGCMAAHFNPSRQYNGTGSSNIMQGQLMFDPALQNQLLLTSSYNGVWLAKQAFTCYVQPSDAPERPDGAGVKISYQLDVMY